MTLAVVIPFHSRRDLLARALASVAGHRVVVVDDSLAGGLDVDAEVVRTPGEVGFARAANSGLDHAQRTGASHALLLNDDATPDDGAIDALQDAWSPGVGAVGPLLLAGDRVESAGMRLSRWGRLVQATTVPAAITDVDALSGACLLVASSERFDPAYRHGMEDVDLCLRLRRRGARVVLQPSARCQHAGGATVGRTSGRAQRHALAGHLRVVGGGIRSPVVVGLAFGQVLSEGADVDRIMAVWQGWRDWRVR